MTKKFSTWFHAPIVRGWALLGFVVLTFGILGAITASSNQAKDSRNAVVQSGRAVSVAGCNRDFINARSVRGVLIAAQAQTRLNEKRGIITASQAADAQAFYDEQLARLTLPDCRKAMKIVTGDPNKTTKIPTPLYETTYETP
jgi:hypothetical protein